MYSAEHYLSVSFNKSRHIHSFIFIRLLPLLVKKQARTQYGLYGNVNKQREFKCLKVCFWRTCSSDALWRTDRDVVRRTGEIESTQAGRLSPAFRRLSFGAEADPTLRGIPLYPRLRLARRLWHTASGICEKQQLISGIKRNMDQTNLAVYAIAFFLFVGCQQ